MTIGNPFGRIALAAVLHRRQIELDRRWKAKELPEPRWNFLACCGYQRDQIIAAASYVDDGGFKSKVVCLRCGHSDISEALSPVHFNIAEPGPSATKFLHVNQHFHEGKLVIRPALKKILLHIQPHLGDLGSTRLASLFAPREGSLLM